MGSNTLKTVNELIAGSVGGAAQVLVGHPLDTVKTRAQIAPGSVSFYLMLTMTHSHNFVHRGHVCAFGIVISVAPGADLATILQKGPMDILKQTVRQEGFFALYKGYPYHKEMCLHQNLSALHRHGKPTGWNCRSQLPALRFIWYFETYNITISPVVSPGNLPCRYLPRIL
jgi:hypothetical protein